MPKTKAKYSLKIIFGKEATRAALESSYNSISAKIRNGTLEGSYSVYHFESEHDRRVAIEILNDFYGWEEAYWEKVNPKSK